jgi:leukotriene-A4 hydrolase
MENPLLTFASPSIVVGDKSGTPVAIHEIAHSWTGNTVTCKDWSNTWINEGLVSHQLYISTSFTVFLERKALFAIEGVDYYKIDATNGNSNLRSTIDQLGKTSSLSSLHPDTNNMNPDDSLTVMLKAISSF